MMDDEKYKQLLDAINDSRRDVESKLTSSLEELKRDITAVQEKASQDLASKINKSTYQFRKKGNEVQFTFNSSVEETISAAKQELSQLTPTGNDQQAALKKAQTHLDEGAKAIEKWQKHIKVADRSDYGWATVQHYDTHPLASDSNDEKRLEKAHRERGRAGGKQASSWRKCLW